MIKHEHLISAKPDLRKDLSDYHYSQLFFVAGHIAIKMLTFIEQIDNELKKSGSDGFGASSGGAQRNSKEEIKNGGNEDKKEEDELDNIAGGKEAEIE